MRDDSRHRIAATVVLAENLREKPPDRDLRSKHAVSELDLMIVENRLDTRLGKHLTERQTVILRKPSAQFVKCRHNQSFVLWLDSFAPKCFQKSNTHRRYADKRQVKPMRCLNRLAGELHTTGSERKTPYETELDRVAASRSRLHEVKDAINTANHEQQRV